MLIKLTETWKKGNTLSGAFPTKIFRRLTLTSPLTQAASNGATVSTEVSAEAQWHKGPGSLH